MKELIIRRPDDWHLHLRDGATLQAVVGASAMHLGRALIMPNLVPPVTDAAAADAYRARILAAVEAAGHAGGDTGFSPLMTLYLTDRSDPAAVVEAVRRGSALAVKLYPAGATTNSDAGVSDIEPVMPVLEAMAEHGVPLCVHGEVTDPAVDIFDREARFLDTVLAPLRQRLPSLSITLEHVTSAEGVAAVQAAPHNLYGSITPHHLMINRNHLLVGGIRPHYYCLPIAKRERHRLALVEAATSGDARFFSGTDSAPHARGAKESACGCAGVFNASVTLSCLAQVFEAAGALHRLEAFVSLNGAKRYGLAPNEGTVRLWRDEVPLEAEAPVQLHDDTIVPFDPGVPLHWRVDATSSAATGALASGAARGDLDTGAA